MSDKKDKKEEEKKKDDAEVPTGKEGEEGAVEGEEGAAPKKSKKKLIIIIAAAILLFGGIGAGLFFSGVIGGGDAKTKDAKKDGDKKDESKDGEKPKLDKDGKPITDAYTDLPNIVVNLSSSSGRTHFVNLKITLELADKEDAKLIEAEMPKIQDSLNTYLRDIRKEDLDGSAGTERLKMELQNRFDKILGVGKVKDILFKEIIVQ